MAKWQIGILAGTLALAAPAATGGGLTLSAQKWVYPRQAIDLQLGSDFNPWAGELRVMAGATDVTSLTSSPASGNLRIDTQASPLTPGQSEIVVYQMGKDGIWAEYGRVPLQVLTSAGFEVSEFDPVGQLTNKGAIDQGHTSEAPAPDPARYQDLASQLGWSTRHVRSSFEMRSRAALVGSSRRQEALQYGQQAGDARKLDLSEYLLELERPSSGSYLALGHVQYGNNPLLINGVSNRGVLFRQRVGSMFDVAVASQNGTRIVGFENVTGLSSSDSNIWSTTLGAEMIPSQPGALRVEASHMDARIKSAVDFGVGEVADAETSRGFGGRVLGNLFGGRVRADLAYARSRYVNPDDPLLAQGDTLVPVEPEINDAWSGRLDFGLIQGLQLGANWPLTLSVGVETSRSDPLYRSLAAYVGADVLARKVDLNSQLGAVGISAAVSESENNLDQVAGMLTSKTRQFQSGLTLPFNSIFLAESGWLPSLSLNYLRVHQFAVNVPDLGAGSSGPPGSGGGGTGGGGGSLPDLIANAYGANLGWSAQQWDFGYSYALSKQDNRQAGRETSDFDNTGHNVNFGLRFLSPVGLNFTLSQTRAYDHERALAQLTDSGGIGLSCPIKAVSLTGSYNLSRNHDSAGSSESRTNSGNARIAWSFEKLPMLSYALPGQVFVSYQNNRNRFAQSAFGLAGDAASWTITSGLSLTLF